MPIVRINNRMLTPPTTECLALRILLLVVSAFCCWKHSVVGRVSILLLKAFCCWSCQHSVCCWSCQHSAVEWQQNRHILIKYSFVGHSIFCCWSNGQLALVPCVTCYDALSSEPRHDKTNKMTVRPEKTQISLGIHPVWSESSLCSQWVAKNPRFLHADSEDSDQPGHPLWSDGAGCPGRSKSSLGEHVSLLDLSWGD